MVSASHLRSMMITTTSYGTWLPGDCRGYVRNGVILPSNPPLESRCRIAMKSRPVFFSDAEQERLFESLCDACDEFGYRLSDVTVENWHLHWIVAFPDKTEAMVGRLKTRMRQSLRRGRVWTEGYHFNQLTDDGSLFAAREYIAKHPGVRMIAGERLAPGSAGGRVANNTHGAAANPVSPRFRRASVAYGTTSPGRAGG